MLIDSGPGFKKPEAQARWEASVERTARFIETKGMSAFVASRASLTAVGLRPELPAARAAARANAPPNPAGRAGFAPRVEAERVTIPRAGHVVNIEEPDAFNAEVIRFLEKLPASPPV